MSSNSFFKVIIITILCIAPSINTYAEDPLDNEVKNLTAIPTVEVLEGVNVNGSTQSIRMLKDPNTGNSVGTINNDDGTMTTIMSSPGVNGATNYSITNNGITTTASVNIDGTTTGDASVVNIASQIQNSPTNTTSASDGKVVTIVSEMVPGAECYCFINNSKSGGMNEACQIGDITTRKYQCTTDSGMNGFQKVFAKMIRFVINIVLLLGVLGVVGLGIAWSFAGGDDMKMKNTLKTWAINLVIGFVILFMFRYILQFLAPWIYK